MPKLKVGSKNGELSVKLGPAQFMADGDSFDFKLKGLKVEGDIQGNTFEGTAKFRGTEVGFDGTFNATGPTYGFQADVGPYDIKATVTVSPTDISGVVSVNNVPYPFDLV